MTPKERINRIENGDNWIVEFWRARGYDSVKSSMGILISLHKEPRYECLGLSLEYLEQFEKECVRRTLTALRKCNYDISYTPSEILKQLEDEEK